MQTINNVSIVYLLVAVAIFFQCKSDIFNTYSFVIVFSSYSRKLKKQKNIIQEIKTRHRIASLFTTVMVLSSSCATTMFNHFVSQPSNEITKLASTSMHC